MKKIFWLVLLIASPLLGQTRTVVTGTVQGATSGYVEFQIQPWSTSVQYFIPGGPVLANQSTRCTITSGSLVKALGGVGDCLIWGTDLISPGNTTYTVVYAPGGTVTNRVARQNIRGTTYDLGSPVFTSVVNIVPQYNTITTPPINANLAPSVDSAFNIGTSGAYYANAYIRNLNVDSLSNVLNITAGMVNGIPTCEAKTGSTSNKVTQAIAQLPTTGGIVDCSGEQGGVIDSNFWNGVTKKVLVIFGAGDFTQSVTLTPGDGQGMKGQGPINRWRQGAVAGVTCPTTFSYTGSTEAVDILAAMNAGKDSVILQDICFNGVSATGAASGVFLDGTASGGYVEGVLFSGLGVYDFPLHQVYAKDTVFDLRCYSCTFHNSGRTTADNVVQYEYDGPGGAASQWTFFDPWMLSYGTGKGAFFAGKTNTFPDNVISDLHIIGGTLGGYDNVNATNRGAWAIWVNGQLSMESVHCEGLPFNQPQTFCVRYTGSNGLSIVGSQISFFGRGVELGNSGFELGGSARLSDESINVNIPEGNAFNNNHCTIAGGASVNCADIYVVQTGNRRSTTLRANSNIETNNTYFGTLNGQPRIVVAPAFSLTTCTNATPIACTTSSAHGYSTGNAVMISDVGGNTAANAWWRITVTGATTFTLDGSIGNGAPTANTGMVSLANNDVHVCNFTVSTSGVLRCAGIFYDQANRMIGINKDPVVSFDVQGPNNQCIRLSNEENSNRISWNTCNVTSVGGTLSGFDGTQINKTRLQGDGVMALDDTVTGVNTPTVDAKALITLTSTTKYFKPPEMTTAQRDAIATPGHGVIYNTTTGALEYYNGAWITLVGTSATVTVRKGDDTGTCNLVFTNGLFISTTC